MTKISFTSNDNGLGSVDFQAPNTNTNHIVSLPNAGGTLHTSGATNDHASMPTVNGDPIVASGSNADGSWTKWADGTQVASNSIATSVSDQTWTFPVTFFGQPRTFGNKDTISNPGFVYFSNTSGSATTLRVSSTGDTARVLLYGRWK